MGKDIVMYYMDKERVCAKIILKPMHKLEFENYSDFIFDRPFGVREKITYKDFEHFLSERCFPRERGNCRDILKALGLDFYEPFEIVKKTHGVMCHDTYWLKFEGESISYKEVRAFVGLN